MSPFVSPPKSAAATVVLVELVALVVVAAPSPSFAAAAYTKRSMPSACLRAATSLCTGSSTNSMTCLKKLAKEGDSRVSQACTLALVELDKHVTTSKATPATRVQAMSRLLTEAGACTGRTVTKNLAGPTATAYTNGYTCGQVCCNSPNNSACCRVLAGSAFCYGSSSCP